MLGIIVAVIVYLLASIFSWIYVCWKLTVNSLAKQLFIFLLPCSLAVSCFIFFNIVYFYLFILAALEFSSCGTWALKFMGLAATAQHMGLVAARQNLVPQIGIKPRPPALGA